MGMRRRVWLQRLAAAGTILAAPLCWALERTLPQRYAEALRARRYPGPTKTVSLTEISKPGSWQG